MLTSDRTLISPVKSEDADAIHHYYDRNQAHLQHWEPARVPDHHSLSAWTARAASQVSDHRAGTSYHFAIRLMDAHAIIGLCNFNNVARGAFQACYLGYSIDHTAEGQGLMHEALAALIPHVFAAYDLHRIMANYMPRNRRSGVLLDRLGFEREGIAKNYLKINGVWEDHVLTARIAP